MIAWHPETTASGEPVRNLDGTLKGHYVCKYRDENGELKDERCENDWMERNFLVPSLAYA